MKFHVWEDHRKLEMIFAKEQLIDILKNAEIGQFDARAWYFWHWVLLDLLDGVPSMPKRFLHDK
jgi:hypothetical protein